MRKKAVTFGRFNLFSNGHGEFIKTILEKWQFVEIVVLENENNLGRYNSVFDDFVDLCNLNYQKSLIDLEHRINLMQIGLKEGGMASKCHVSTFLRPELHPKEFNMLFPKDQFDVVFSVDVHSNFDIKKIGMFELLLGRKIELVYPSKIMHNSNIQKNGNLEQYYQNEVLNYCKKYNLL